MLIRSLLRLGALSAGTRKRRHRTIFTEEQLNMLEEAFSGTQYSDVSVREVLADKCNLTRRSLVQESACQTAKKEPRSATADHKPVRQKKIMR
uniref:Homeobox domain-containing protein n=1 Tax=Globodera pallida TaxID=36090 RepID=A0A183CGC2_GLOPA